MQDRYAIAVIIYISMVIIVASVIPTYLYSGSLGSQYETESIQGTYNGTIQGEAAASYTWIQKVLTFMFLTWEIQGIPAFLASIILLMNFITTVIGAVWVYDKLRGIG